MLPEMFLFEVVYIGPGYNSECTEFVISQTLGTVMAMMTRIFGDSIEFQSITKHQAVIVDRIL